MAVPSQIFEIPLREGIDRKTNGKLVAPTKLLKLEDGVIGGQLGLEPRNGYVAFDDRQVDGTEVAGGKALGRFRDELLLFNAGAMYSYSTALARWISKGGVTPFRARAEIVYGQRASAANPDMARHEDGVAVYAWRHAAAGVRCTVVDDDTGASFLAAQQVSATGVRPRCVAVGTHLLILYVEGANLYGRRIDVANPGVLEAAVLLRNDLAAAKMLDVCAAEDASIPGPGAIFAYSNAAGGTTVGYVLEDLRVGDGANGFPSPLAMGGEDSSQAIAVVNHADNGVAVAFAGAAEVRGCALAANLLGFDPADVQTIAVEANAENVTFAAEDTNDDGGIDNYHVFYEVSAAAATNRVVWYAKCAAALSPNAAAAVLKRSVGLASKAFQNAGRVYVHVVFAGELQNTFFLVDHAGAIHGRILGLNAGGLQTGGLPSVVEPVADDGEFLWPAPVRTRFESDGNITYSDVGIAKSTLTFEDVGQYRGAQAGDCFLVPGGLVGHYDGGELVEHGFHVYPEGLVAADATKNAAGGSMTPGTRFVTWLYEWFDAKGQVHRSAPHPAIEVVTPAGTNTNRWSFPVPTLRLSGKTNVRIVMYSTEDAGLVFYRTPHQAGTAVDGVDNDPTVDAVTFERTVDDGDLLANETVYTQGLQGATGGELENIAAPAAALVAVGKRRAVLAGLEEPTEYLISKIIVPGFGVAFAQELRYRVEANGGAITGVAMLDDKIVLFKRDAIYVVYGDGPDNTGENDTFSAPQLVQGDVGCIDSRSIVSGPNGVYFQSAKGIWLLDRSLTPQYVGAAVEAFNGQTISAATVLDDVNQVRFLVAPAADEADGQRTTRTLVFDYFLGQWSTFANHEGRDAVLWNDQYVYLRDGGQVWREDPDVGLDGDGRAIHMRWRTAWLPKALLQGFLRVRRLALLGDFLTTHMLKGIVYVDYRDFPVEEFTFDPAPTQEGGSSFGDGNFGDGSFGGEQQVVADRVYQMRHHCAQQKVEAISLEVVDEGNTPGQAYSIAALALEVAALPGLMRLPHEKSA